jgi:response regulator RpfG family c-di-GMP phosphodiesterase/HPt (histidine-containing phosphotransfer) domain-containing protein
MTDPYFSEAMLEIDQSIIKDFFDEFNDMYELVITSTTELEDPKKYNSTLINSVFRGVHSIKSNLRMVGLTTLSTIVHHLENILDQVRHEQCSYIPEYGDIIRLVLDETRISAGKYFNKEKDPITEELRFISNIIEHICNNPQNRQDDVEMALKLLDPFNKGKPLQQRIMLNKEDNVQINTMVTSNNNYPYAVDDLNFFKQIFELIKKRIQFPSEKMELINKVALKMNELSNFKVEQIQLQAAIYLYNWGISTLPINLIMKKEMLNDEEINIIKTCQLRAVELLKDLPFWKTAHKIIEQCHERPDGLGYPNKLKKDEICDGAKILALANSFGAIFYTKTYQQINTRTIMAAILAINNEVGTQFDEYWTDLFNKSIKSLHQEQQLLKS